MAETDTNLSFEAIGADFEYKVGQKIGMAVYRNYEFDFTNDEIYTNLPVTTELGILEITPASKKRPASGRKSP